jgi:hypothetical protein
LSSLPRDTGDFGGEAIASGLLVAGDLAMTMRDVSLIFPDDGVESGCREVDGDDLQSTESIYV